MLIISEIDNRGNGCTTSRDKKGYYKIIHKGKSNKRYLGQWRDGKW